MITRGTCLLGDSWFSLCSFMPLIERNDGDNATIALHCTAHHVLAVVSISPVLCVPLIHCPYTCVIYSDKFKPLFIIRFVRTLPAWVCLWWCLRSLCMHRRSDGPPYQNFNGATPHAVLDYVMRHGEILLKEVLHFQMHCLFSIMHNG